MTYEEGGVNANVTPVVVGMMKTQNVQQIPVLSHICEMYMQNMQNILNMHHSDVYA
jgi:hypothetical protein